ncbi:MAG: hypothetical protein RLY16_1959 [Bacteroidota bacterium]
MEAAVWIIAIIATAILLLRMGILINLNKQNKSLENKGLLVVNEAIGSLKGMEGLILGFGWGAIIFWDAITSLWMLLLIASASGIIFLYFYHLLLQEFSIKVPPKLFTAEQTIGKHAEVVQLIPPRKYGKGKIVVMVGEANYEMEAITNHVYKLERGLPVKIIAIENSDLLLVIPE